MDHNFIRWVKGRKVTVVGAGVSGMAAARALSSLGAIVLVTDQSILHASAKAELQNMGVAIEDGGHTDRVFDAELIVVSPGVRPDSRIFREAKERGIKLIGELELGYLLTSGRYIAVTGTNGKSTVVSLTAHILSPMGALAVGNIGQPLSSFAMSGGLFVVEASSFQLYTIETFKPDIAVITNISSDHIDWHSDFESYCNAKLNITKNQSPDDYLILNGDENGCMRLASELTQAQVRFISLQNHDVAAYLDPAGNLVISDDGRQLPLVHRDEMLLKGQHNLINALFAALASYLIGAGVDHIRRGLKTFRSLPHRLEFVDEIHGVKFYNDSKGTNPHAVRWALKSFDKPVILIMGGEDKGMDFSPLISDVWKNTKFLVVLGKAKDKLRCTFGHVTKVIEATDMNDAVLKAYRKAEPGDIILLSPGCASFDMFKNYRERGEAFVNAVKSLKGQECA